jgi:hypothetical protein
MSAQNNTQTKTTSAPLPLSSPRFPLGRTLITPGALEALDAAGQHGREFLDRHVRGDWGDLSDDDKRENEFSVDKPLRIFSAYHTAKGVKLWVITEADRSATTILLPEEY